MGFTGAYITFPDLGVYAAEPVGSPTYIYVPITAQAFRILLAQQNHTSHRSHSILAVVAGLYITALNRSQARLAVAIPLSLLLMKCAVLCL